VPQDYAEAVRWCREAADQGCTTAQASLGFKYALGEVVTRDYVQAHIWMNLAASRASGDDQERYARTRDSLAGVMTAEQLTEAQHQAAAWRPK
jgi:TPR repeat protein